MKKVISLSMVCLMVLSICAVFSCTEKDFDSGKYVDLGLPSGTKWKDVDESTGDFNLYTYDQAIKNFGDKIPTKKQFVELQSSCMWTWTGNGYKVVGPNGKSISLPAAGCRSCNGGVHDMGSYGYYWSSTPKDSEYAWELYFSSGGVNMGYDYRCSGLSVRLVQD